MRLPAFAIIACTLALMTGQGPAVHADDAPATASLARVFLLDEPGPRNALPPLEPGAILPAIIPPLSIYESRNMLISARANLEQPGRDGLTTNSQVVYYDRVLAEVAGYIEHIDRIHPSLPHYDWTLISAEKIPEAEGWGTRRITPRRALAGIHALALRVNNNDIEIQSLRVTGSDDRVWLYQPALRLPAERPRPEVFFLPFPTDLVEVEIVCRQVEVRTEQLPRLYVRAGTCRLPESARQAVFLIHRAREALRRAHPARANELISRVLILLEAYQDERAL